MPRLALLSICLSEEVQCHTHHRMLHSTCISKGSVDTAACVVSRMVQIHQDLQDLTRDLSGIFQDLQDLPRICQGSSRICKITPGICQDLFSGRACVHCGSSWTSTPQFSEAANELLSILDHIDEHSIMPRIMPTFSFRSLQKCCLHDYGVHLRVHMADSQQLSMN